MIAHLSGQLLPFFEVHGLRQPPLTLVSADTALNMAGAAEGLLTNFLRARVRIDSIRAKGIQSGQT